MQEAKAERILHHGVHSVFGEGFGPVEGVVCECRGQGRDVDGGAVRCDEEAFSVPDFDF